MNKKKILFITGTRADFGKLKPLIEKVNIDPGIDTYIFATGMHTLEKYGRTINEIYKCGYRNIFEYMNQRTGDPMDLVLANTIEGLSRYTHENNPDMIIIHGDRVEALAGSIVGALNNILVAHIEGGEVSGTIDESIRHSVSKLSHLHFVANDESRTRLIQLGENADCIFIIGSPDIDIMLSDKLPTMIDVRERYQIPFDGYAIVLLHPVTTETDLHLKQAQCFVDALIESNRNYVVIYPNNDEGCEVIHQEYKRLQSRENIKLFPSLRFEWFLRLLKESEFIIGNSSAGVREAPVYAVPSIDMGTRQQNRFMCDTIIHAEFSLDSILSAIDKAANTGKQEPSMHFGTGNSAQLFYDILCTDNVWMTSKQKMFRDMRNNKES
jgi:UDP-N-acetylglucosamine 2-epimerase (hydrolysing)